MKTFEATCLGRGSHSGNVWVELTTGERIELKAGADTQDAAERLQGRRVRFQAMLHESTLSLASPIFVIGSQFGLQAVAGATVKAEAAE